MSVLLAFVAAGLFGCGLYLVLSRHVVRMVLGLSLLTTAVNLVVFQAGRIRSAQPPLIAQNAQRLGESADPLPQDRERVSETLKSAGLDRSESWSFADRFHERLRYEIDPAWAGELPRTVLIDADGKTTVLPGVADLAQVKAWLDAQSKPGR